MSTETPHAAALAVTAPSHPLHTKSIPTSPGVTSSIRSHHDSLISHPHSPLVSDPPSPPSIASVSVKNERESFSHSDAERGWSTDHGRVQRPAPVAKRDPEKRVMYPVAPPSESHSRTYHADPEIGIDTFEPSDAYELEGKAVRILLYLSTLCPVLSMGILMWTLGSIIISIVLLPVHVFMSTKLPTLPSLLLPPLRLQLRLIYSFGADDALDATSASPYLFLTHLASPFVAPMVAVGSWVAAFFWFFSAVLGDPAGKDGHNDGRAAVLWVRNKWESWLLNGLR